MDQLHPIILFVTHALAVAGGFGIASWAFHGAARAARSKAWREAEELMRARALQDHRDTTSARLPFGR